MKIALINDTHFGARGDSLSFNSYFFKFWDNVFFPYLEQNNIKTVFHLGDLVDRRKYMSYVILSELRERFIERFAEEGIDLHVLIGNHDCPYKNTNKVNAMDELFSLHPMKVYSEPMEIILDGLLVAIVPWINASNHAETVQFIEKTKAEVMFGHLEIAGFEMDKGNVCQIGLDRKMFNKFDMVLSGHFHHKSTDGQIHYLGAQYEMTWADYNDQRGFHIFDTETRELSFVPNPYKMFNKVEYDDIGLTIDQIKEADYSEFENTYVKVVVVNKTNPYAFDIFLDKLYKANALNISIVEDLSFMQDVSDDETIDEAEDASTILGKYIDGLQLEKVDIPKLKSIMKSLYVEACNFEVVP